jgi:hypothetical protein
MKPTGEKCHLHAQGVKEDSIALKVEMLESGKVCCKRKERIPKVRCDSLGESEKSIGRIINYELATSV